MREPFTRLFTDQFLRALKPARKPYKRSEHAPRGEGRLIVRVRPGGSKELFYRYREGKADTLLKLGLFDHTGRTGLTLSQARAKLKDVRQVQRDTGDVKAHRQEQERQAEIAGRKGTFRQLLAAYVQALNDAKRPSAAAVEGIFRRNVLEPFAKLADTKADAIEPGDVQRILARMVRAGITRQVNVTRSYIRAAFAHGIKADHDPRTIAREGVLFGLKYNPAASVPRIQEYERTGDRVLSADELRLYWHGLDALPLAQRATLRVNLALACQRPTQLLRAAWGDFDFTQRTLLLRDTKGRGGARDHLLPLSDFVLRELKPLRELNAAKDAPPFSSDAKRTITDDTLSKAVRALSDKLHSEQSVPKFQLRDLRRTAETMLQQLGIDREVRAHLLSHGRTQGVQGKHYERYNFLPEKRKALERWNAHLSRIIEGKQAAKIVAMRSA